MPHQPHARASLSLSAAIVALVTAFALLVVPGSADAAGRPGQPHRIGIRVSTAPTTAGTRVTVRGKVRMPRVAHRRIALQRWDGSRWVRQARTRVTARRTYRLQTTLTATTRVRVNLRGHRKGDTSRARRIVVVPPTTTPPPVARATYRSLSANSTACVVTTADDSLRCWGYNGYGTVGDGTRTDTSTPTVVPGRWRSVSTDGYATCAVKVDGTLWCWGYNGYGALGDGTSTDRLTPGQVGSDTDWDSVVAGYYTSCGIRAGGVAYCWGENEYGGVGNGGSSSADYDTPTAVAGGHTFASLAVDYYNACGLTTGRQILCWGYGGYGAVGDGTATDRFVPTAISTTGVTGAATWSTLSVTGYSACAVTTARVGYCWGYNSYGTVGDGTTTQVDAPVAVSGDLAGGLTSLSTNVYNSCALTAGGTAHCWGYGGYHANGTGSTSDTTTPSAAAEVLGDHRWSSVVAGYYEACGIADDVVYCWGDNSYGVLGTTGGADSDTPVAVAGL